MSEQVTFASLAYDGKKKTTQRERFLNEMERAVPWKLLEKVIEPHYPDIGNGRPPYELGRMLRIHCMQQWFQLSDPGMEDALYDSESIRRFAGIELGRDAVPDETTILNFRHLLEAHKLAGKIFEEVGNFLQDRGLQVRNGTIMDATIISASKSRKNEAGKPDPEMRHTQKNGQWYFGMKAHIGVDTKSRVVHSATFTAANIHEVDVMEQLVHGQERVLYGDSAYTSEARRRAYAKKGVVWNIARRASRAHPLSKRDLKWNERRSRVRSRVEHVFGVIKHLWGYTKVRFRGLEKNASQFLTLLTLSNLYLVRKKLCAA